MDPNMQQYENVPPIVSLQGDMLAQMAFPPPPNWIGDDFGVPTQASELAAVEVVLPTALEEVLALKDRRALQLGNEEVFAIDGNDVPTLQKVTYSHINDVEPITFEPEYKSTINEKPPGTKSEKTDKNKKKKKRSKRKRSAKAGQTSKSVEQKKSENHKEEQPDVVVEYVQESINLHELAPQYRQFYSILESFKIPDQKQDIPPPILLTTPTTLSTSVSNAMQQATNAAVAAANAVARQTGMVHKTGFSTGTAEEEQDEDGEGLGEGELKLFDDKMKLSKRKLKKLTRLSVAELKQLVNRPDVVEMHDVTARDPKLLVQLKAHRNTVQVPRHWCFKRKYLQGKRGIEKPPFNLPDFIKRTGIMEMRASLQEKDDSKTLKAKMREKARPKLGKIDIDYQKLHDAFFKWQIKPKLTIHGDLYYEGKEFETRLKEKKPGDLSEELRTALGMPVGMNAHRVPPPWLIAMQRYGPPPSYPNLKIPGLNAPIPEGCAFGYHAGGWGKPPVDENGKPLYGDVFGTQLAYGNDLGEDASIDRTLWGELESESEEEEEEDEDEEGDGEGGMDAGTADGRMGPPDGIEGGLMTPGGEGLITPSGLTSVPMAGMETPEAIELRKKKIENEMETGAEQALYHVIPERRPIERMTSAMMASAHVYDLSGVQAGPKRIIPGVNGPQVVPANMVEREGMVELALDPSELDMDSDAMAVRYEQQMRENQSQLQKEDLSDMLAEHVAKQKNKRKRAQQQETSKQSKKYKEFKF